MCISDNHTKPACEKNQHIFRPTWIFPCGSLYHHPSMSALIPQKFIVPGLLSLSEPNHFNTCNHLIFHWKYSSHHTAFTFAVIVVPVCLPYHWLFSLLLLKGGQGIFKFNVHNTMCAYCAQENKNRYLWL